MEIFLGLIALLVLTHATGCSREPDAEKVSVEKELPEQSPVSLAQDQPGDPASPERPKTIEVDGYLVDLEGLTTNWSPDSALIPSGEKNHQQVGDDSRGFFKRLRLRKFEPKFETGVPDTKPQSLITNE